MPVFFYALHLFRRLADADLSTSAMESALLPLADHLSCDVCKRSLGDRVKQLIIQWSVVKVCATHSHTSIPH